MEDMRSSVSKFYEFLKSYDYIEATTKIQSTIYEEARKYISSSAPLSDPAGDIPCAEDEVKKIETPIVEAVKEAEVE